MNLTLLIAYSFVIDIIPIVKGIDLIIYFLIRNRFSIFSLQISLKRYSIMNSWNDLSLDFFSFAFCIIHIISPIFIALM